MSYAARANKNAGEEDNCREDYLYQVAQLVRQKFAKSAPLGSLPHPSDRTWGLSPHPCVVGIVRYQKSSHTRHALWLKFAAHLPKGPKIKSTFLSHICGVKGWIWADSLGTWLLAGEPGQGRGPGRSGCLNMVTPSACKVASHRPFKQTRALIEHRLKGVASNSPKVYVSFLLHVFPLHGLLAPLPGVFRTA